MPYLLYAKFSHHYGDEVALVAVHETLKGAEQSKDIEEQCWSDEGLQFAIAAVRHIGGGDSPFPKHKLRQAPGNGDEVTDLFAGTRGPRNAKYMIVGESWGVEEAREGKPFVGTSGEELCLRILPECNIPESECFFTNVVNARPAANKMEAFFYPTEEMKGQPSIRGLYPQPIVVEGLRLLEAQIATVRPEVIVGFGNYTLWALTEDSFRAETDTGKRIPRGIGDWRGSQLWSRAVHCEPTLSEVGGLRRFRLLPTYHPAAIFRTWPWRYLITNDLKTRVPKALNGTWETPAYRFSLHPSFEEVERRLYFLEDIAAVALDGLDLSVDIETHGSFITCIGLAWSPLDAICIPFTRRGQTAGYWTPEEEIAIVLHLRRLLRNPRVHIIGQNFMYDAQYIAHYWMFVPHIAFDTMSMHQLCWPGGGDPEKRRSKAGGPTMRDLVHLSSLYCNHHEYWKEKRETDEEEWAYNCTDAVKTWEVKQELAALIARLGLQEQAACQMEQINELMMPMMLRGVNVDKKRKAEITFELAEVISRYEEWLENILPEDAYPRKPKQSPWYRSNPQQNEIFYDLLGAREVKHHKRKTATVDADALVRIALREPLLAPITQKLGEYRQLCTFHNNFATALLDPDGRMRCRYDFISTFRWRSGENVFGRGTNLQNIPKGTEE